jgi:hypothetical protein
MSLIPCSGERSHSGFEVHFMLILFGALFLLMLVVMVFSGARLPRTLC